MYLYICKIINRFTTRIIVFSLRFAVRLNYVLFVMNDRLMDNIQGLLPGRTVCLHVFLSEPLGDGTSLLIIHGQNLMDNLFFIVTTALHFQCFTDVEVQAPHSLIVVKIVCVAEHGLSGDSIVEENAGVIRYEQVGYLDEVVEIWIICHIDDECVGW